MVDNTNKPAVTAPQPITHDDRTLGQAPKKRKKSYAWLSITLGSVGVLLGTIGILLGIYNQALLPVDAKDTTERTVTIVSGTTPSEIGKQLKEENIIRSEAAFGIYTRITGVQNKLQAGTYQLRPSDSTQRIVTALVEGPQVNEFEVTFLPGATLADHRQALVSAGFSEREVDAAFAAQYDHPLLAGRPATADLEGYIYGETHRFTEGTTAQQVLTRFFDDYYKVIQDNDLVQRYRAQGLTLYEGITLASIIQRESGGEDKAQIAQVFLLRLDRGMELGSDVTYQYIADKLGVPRDINLDNPYNTRRYTGLPPGPIASPGDDALIATGNPARGNYLYFLSGDDDVTYFARTLAEHEANIRRHCQQKCQII